jgi:uncharacterized protein (DUF1778 family)
MVTHANNRHKQGKRKRAGVLVGKRYRVDVYIGSQEDVEMVDKAASLRRMTRSAFGSYAMLKEARKTILDAR